MSRNTYVPNVIENVESFTFNLAFNSLIATLHSDTESFLKGDGGSPLVCPTDSGAYEVVGLVTWGIGCANGGVPGVYTDVFHFRSWVMQEMT